jgi:hypothetical protein
MRFEVLKWDDYEITVSLDVLSCTLARKYGQHGGTVCLDLLSLECVVNLVFTFFT